MLTPGQTCLHFEEYDEALRAFQAAAQAVNGELPIITQKLARAMKGLGQSAEANTHRARLWDRVHRAQTSSDIQFAYLTKGQHWALAPA